MSIHTWSLMRAYKPGGARGSALRRITDFNVQEAGHALGHKPDLDDSSSKIFPYVTGERNKGKNVLHKGWRENNGN